MIFKFLCWSFALTAIPSFSQEFVAIEAGAGFLAPTSIASPRDGSGRLFVAEHGGSIQILEPDGSLTPFLDITERVFARLDFCCNEQGLLGITFPPGDGPKDHIFLSYVDRFSNSIVSRFNISTETGLADPDSEVVLQKLYHPDVNHYAGSIAFHPTGGLLYWSMGDGSAGNNVLFSQDWESPFGKILRFDPYAEKDPKLEIYAKGLRNPWRMAFDSATGDLYIGDVGENTFEEVNFIASGTPAGEVNFGWGVTEGYFCYEFGQCITDGITPPIVAYDHQPSGCAVTAGEVYRGESHPDWYGKYFFADFCFGHVWETHVDEDSNRQTTKVLDETFHAISTFGVGENKEIYFADYIQGLILRLDEATPVEATMGPAKQRTKR